MIRHLFLIAYDISSASRRSKVLNAVKAHATGGEKSLYECWQLHGLIKRTHLAILRAPAEMRTAAILVERDSALLDAATAEMLSAFEMNWNSTTCLCESNGSLMSVSMTCVLIMFRRGARFLRLANRLRYQA